MQGVLRFPQRFRMVFCGEVVAVWWWKRGSWTRIFVCLKMCHGFEIYFWVDFGKAKATAKAKAIILSLRPSGFAPAFGRAEHGLARYLDLSYEYAGH